MGLRGRLAQLAATAPAPVFAVAAPAAHDEVRRLRLDPRVELLDTPRQASVLLLAGELPPSLDEVVPRVHDQMPAPRATVRAAELPGDAVVAAWRGLLTGERASEPDLLPDVDPAPWRGIGPYGQGGTGMTGGVPYGRPMTGRAPDRDRLELDQLAARLGPILPALPPGLELDVRLQGDVVQEASVVHPAAWPAADDLFRRAVGGGVRVVDLELARARHHLRWLSDALRVAGRPALGIRTLAVAESPALDAALVERLERRIRRDPVLRVAQRRVGVVRGPGLGPASRAAGIADDERSRDPAYVALGFEPVVHDGGDVASRWRQRLGEARQSLALAAAAESAVVEPSAVEGLRGPQAGRGSSALLDELPAVLAGLEWGDAVATIWSLDVEPVAAAVRA